MIARLMKRSLVMGAALVPALLGAPTSAQACGGFFCSAAALPINQAAEKIIFAENGDGTVTAVIQILYEGPAPNFSWLLPISSVPQAGQTIGVASNLAFQRLQNATNPQYSLTTRVEGTCNDGNSGAQSAGAPSFRGGTGSGGSGGSSISSDGVTVEASGTVGAFEWTAISLDPAVQDPADVAVRWLQDNGYLVSPGAPGLIRPYLLDGLYLLALRLTKGADTGSIRPLMLTYAANQPMIPIKLTAVAANDDMGVMTWLLSGARGVPQNYLGLELNEARINWFNAASNYNDVVTAAADEASGQGFVAEFAGPSTTLSQVVWTTFDEMQWQRFKNTVYSSFEQIFSVSYGQWGTWDGFWDAVRAAPVMLTGGVSLENFRLCPTCYAGQVQLSPSGYIAALEANVIKPMKDVQNLIDAHPYITRLYTTMSASEMTVDPLFSFNPDLADVSNIHSATRVIECSSKVNQFEAPWRIELPQGGIVRGTASQVGSWPADFSTQPANTRVLKLSASGKGAVLEDNGKAISALLDNYNSAYSGSSEGSSGGCAVASGRSPTLPWALAAFAAFACLRRRRAK
jgi:hypothetical protein